MNLASPYLHEILHRLDLGTGYLGTLSAGGLLHGPATFNDGHDHYRPALPRHPGQPEYDA
ncbi:hypothetical protein [Streptomyces sp. NPDC052036]|uniref:hypothetical protein n=1 Tax=Streptomyces sp. NPDC052036 TaxID=3155171 RepID=UPI00342D96DE